VNCDFSQCFNVSSDGKSPTVNCSKYEHQQQEGATSSKEFNSYSLTQCSVAGVIMFLYCSCVSLEEY